MVDIKKEELVKMGEGTFFINGQKLYVPSNVIEFLKLEDKTRIEYKIILDPKYAKYVIIEKIE